MKSAGEMAYADAMAALDGVLRVITLPGTTKLVRDGVTIARAIAYTDGTVEVIDASGRRAVDSWEIAAAWIAARVTSEVLTSEGCELINFTARAA